MLRFCDSTHERQLSSRTEHTEESGIQEKAISEIEVKSRG
jgi:hypothetical protein